MLHASPESLMFVATSSVLLGVLSGWLGVGGGLLLIPCLMQIAPFCLGVTLFTLPQATGLAALQGVAASSSSAYNHYKGQRVQLAQVWRLAPFLLTGSTLGAFLAPYLPEALVLGLLLFCLGFTGLSSLNALLKKARQAKAAMPTEVLPERQLPLWLMASAVFTISFLSGVLGIGGAIFLLPLFFIVLRWPERLAIGTIAALVFIMTVATTLGKAAIIPWDWGLFSCGFAMFGGWLGAVTHTKVPVLALRWLHLGLVTAAFVLTTQQWLSLF